MYFQDGTWGSSLSSVEADYIAIGTVGNTVQISSINYGTNTITLSSAKTWNDNANIWLYKDSDGTIVLQGSAPDYGAYESDASPSAAITGTCSDGATEAQIVAGGETIIITLTNDTWGATVGDDNAITTALIAGIDSGGSEATGWDAVVKANMVYTDVTRTSDTVVTVTLGAEATYQITQNETITVTVPATALIESGNAVVGSPTFEIDASDPAAVLTGTMLPTTVEADIVTGGETIIITLSDCTWHADIGTDCAQTTALINSIDSAQAEATGWDAVVKAGLDYDDVTRNSDTVATITLPAFASYDISDDESITVTISADCTSHDSAIIATPTVGIIHYSWTSEKTEGMTLGASKE